MYIYVLPGEDSCPVSLGLNSALEDMLAEKLDKHREIEDQNKVSAKVLVMQPILRFLQLLCENHNPELQASEKYINYQIHIFIYSFLFLYLFIIKFNIYDIFILFFNQNLLRNQNNKTNFNLVSETLMFLDCICGSTTGGLGLLGLYINEHNVALINQTLETLTEYCQVNIN